MRSLLRLSAVLLLSFPSHAEFDLSGVSSEDVNTLLSSANTMMQAQSSPLVDSLVSDLSISPQQATTGAGALLSLAQNSLSTGQQSELSSLIPGLEALTNSGLLSSIETMESVQSAFASVGLDASMIAQFAPIVLQYLNSQGASSGLIGSLTTLWQ